MALRRCVEALVKDAGLFERVPFGLEGTGEGGSVFEYQLDSLCGGYRSSKRTQRLGSEVGHDGDRDQG